MKKEFVKPEIKSLRLRENILAGSQVGGGDVAGKYVVKAVIGDVQHMCYVYV